MATLHGLFHFRLVFYDKNDNFTTKVPSLLNNIDVEDVPSPNYLITPPIDAYKDINCNSNLPTLSIINISNYLDRYTR